MARPIKSIAILTGGGDCPGLNAAIYRLCKLAWAAGYEVRGILEGWKGLLENKTISLDEKDIARIMSEGGTILGCSRVNPLKQKNGLKRCLENWGSWGCDVLFTIGGEGTIRVAEALSKHKTPLLLIPKTIDNDLWGTDYSIGFHTAVQTATNAIDRLRTTTEAHQRVMIMEVMGRHAGWIALYAGIAGGVDAIVIPEKKTAIEQLCKLIDQRKKNPPHYALLVVSEDARIQLENRKILRTSFSKDEYGYVKLGGIGQLLGGEIAKRLAIDVNVTVLGHLQRGGSPTAHDRFLAVRFADAAFHLFREKKFGQMVCLQGSEINHIPLHHSAGKLKRVSPKEYSSFLSTLVSRQVSSIDL